MSELAVLGQEWWWWGRYGEGSIWLRTRRLIRISVLLISMLVYLLGSTIRSCNKLIAPTALSPTSINPFSVICNIKQRLSESQHPDSHIHDAHTRTLGSLEIGCLSSSTVSIH